MTAPTASLVIFTDLDGTLLDHDTYSWEAAREGLRLVHDAGAALVFCSSKTRAEIEWLQRQLRVRHPFISENGGALFVPEGYFPFEVRSRIAEGTAACFRDAGYEVVQFGRRYADVVVALDRAAAATGVTVAAFHAMSVAQIAEECDLPPAQACLAKLREYDEPFKIVRGREERCAFPPSLAVAPDASRQLPRSSPRTRLFAALAEAGFRCTRGSRFDHVTGSTDKGVAVHQARVLYERAAGCPLPAAGLGDSYNDLPLLAAVDLPIVVPNREGDAARLCQKVPSARVCERRGAAGWNQAIADLLGGGGRRPGRADTRRDSDVAGWRDLARSAR